MRQYLTLIFAILLPLFMFTGCGDSGPEVGGDRTVIIEGGALNLDPQSAVDETSFTVIKNIFSTLVTVDDKGAVTPCAAESYQVSDDGLEYTFHLREGLVWKRGKEKLPLKANDYVYAVKRIFDPDTHSPYGYLFRNIENIDGIGSGSAGIYAPDDHTLCIRLVSPDCDFLKKLAHPAASPCSEELFLSTQGRYGLSKEDTFSCGAFYVSEWNYDPYWTGSHLTLTRYKPNSLEGHVTYPDSVDLVFGSGEKPVMFPDDMADSIEFDKKDYSAVSIVSGSYILLFNTQGVFADEALRQAVFTIICDGSKCPNAAPCSRLLPENISIGGFSQSGSGEHFALSPLSDDPSAAFRAVLEEERLDHRVILVPEDFPKVSEMYEIAAALEKQDFFSQVKLCGKSEFDELFSAGEYDICVYPVTAAVNSADMFLERLYELSGAAATERLLFLSAIKDGTDKAEYAYSVEQYLYSSGYALMLCPLEREYYLLNEAGGYIIDPYTGAIDFKQLIIND